MRHNFTLSLKKIMYLFLLLIAFSCDTDQDIVYMNPVEDSVATVQSFEANPGKNRVQIKGIVDADEISEIEIFWNDRSESMIIPVDGSSGTVSETITGLSEGDYMFEVVAKNNAGNTSKTITAGTTVFGNTYESAIANRSVNSHILRDNTLDINFESIGDSPGAIGTQLEYENNEGEVQSLFIDTNTDRITIQDFNEGASYSFRSVFVPAPTAIDTFYTGYASDTPIQFPVLQNAAVPFAADSISGRWGVLSTWTTNEAARNHGGYGGWDQWNNNIFNMESGWGSPAITNGKIYQQVTAGEGNYTLRIVLRDTNHSADDEGGSYFVVTAADDFPDVEIVESNEDVVAYARTTSATLTYNIDFTLEETTDILIGQVSTQWGQTPGRYCNIISWEIVPGS